MSHPNSGRASVSFDAAQNTRGHSLLQLRVDFIPLPSRSPRTSSATRATSTGYRPEQKRPPLAVVTVALSPKAIPSEAMRFAIDVSCRMIHNTRHRVTIVKTNRDLTSRIASMTANYGEYKNFQCKNHHHFVTTCQLEIEINPACKLVCFAHNFIPLYSFANVVDLFNSLLPKDTVRAELYILSSQPLTPPYVT
jgi:hypothetical protein